MKPTVEYRILGPLQVLVAGQERPVAGEKQQALLARLLLEPNRPVSTDSLIDDLWGEQAPATARQSLHAHVTRLRRTLALDDGSSPLGNDGRGYVLRVEQDRLDAARFRATVAAAREERRAGRVGAARERFAAALALCRGPVLDGVALDRAQAERSELEGLRAAALEERIDADLELGRTVELVPELERLVRDDPLRERPWAQLMLALYASGRQADALAAYAIWVVTYWNRQVVRIDPERRRVLDRIPTGAGPLAVAVGAGAVWVTNRDSRTITRIDPASGEVADVIRLDAAPYGIQIGHGRVWVTTQRCGSMGC